LNRRGECAGVHMASKGTKHFVPPVPPLAIEFESRTARHLTD